MNRRQKLYSYAIKKVHEQHGVVSLIMAVSTTMLLGFTALAIDLGHAWMVKQELQNVADAAALAGAGQLGQMYKGMPVENQSDYILTAADKQIVVDQINSLTPNSYAGGILLAFRAEDIEVGVWDSTTKTFTAVDPGALRPTAVRVQVRRDEMANTPLPTFLAGIVGVEGIDLAASATAALTSLTIAPPGELGVPFAISENWLKTENCRRDITFHPTPDSCAGWHSFTDMDAANGHDISEIITGLTPPDGTYTTPETHAGETKFNFIGGTVASAYRELEILFDLKKTDGTWSVLVPVYGEDSAECKNPKEPITIVGFVTVTISKVKFSGKIIEAVVSCDTFESGRGGGSTVGETWDPIGTIPGLVL